MLQCGLIDHNLEHIMAYYGMAECMMQEVLYDGHVVVTDYRKDDIYMYTS